MIDEQYLLDTSAIKTWIEDEEGADRVDEILHSHEIIIAWTALMEVYYITWQERGEPIAFQQYAALRQLPVKFLANMDEQMTLRAGNLKAQYRLSFADTIVAAYALQENAVLVHKDPEFEALNGQVKLESLPYKNPLKPSQHRGNS